jgi:hypothetical protein
MAEGVREGEQKVSTEVTVIPNSEFVLKFGILKDV